MRAVRNRARSLRPAGIRVGLAVVLAIAVGLPAVGQTTDPLSARAPSLAPMLARVLPAVVSIKVAGERLIPKDLPPFTTRADLAVGGVADLSPGAGREKFTSSGSGVIIDAHKGLIVTNDHVIAQSSTIEVTLQDGRRLAARVVGIDPATDIAVLSIDATGLVAVPIGDSDVLRIGDYVVAVGNPLGLAGSASQGIVSGLKRTDVGYETIEDFIQTDAAINKGNSGGALVNLRGELIGINTASVGSSGSIGIGFAVPSRIVKGVVDQLVAIGRIERGILGIRVEPFTLAVANQLRVTHRPGALAARVTPASPAADAGIVAGDVVIELNGRVVSSSADFLSSLALGFVGRTADVTIVRGDQRIQHRMTYGIVERQRQPVPVIALDAQRRFEGLILGALEPGLPLFGEVQGAFVIAVTDRSLLQRSGLAAGDVIVSFDGIKIRSPQEALQAIELLPTITRLHIVRDGVPYWVRLGPS